MAEAGGAEFAGALGVPSGAFVLRSLNSNWEFPKIGVPYFGVLIMRILLYLGS